MKHLLAGRRRASVPLLLATASLFLVACRGAEPRAEEELATAGSDTSAAAAAQAPAPPAAAAEQAANQIAVADVGFQGPESVVHDATADVYLVSNINGSPFEKADNGFISRLSPDGRVLDLKWIDGEDEAVTLHAPKGVALKGDSLYVADIDVVRVFDRDTGRPLAELAVPGAAFLNDVATGPDGALYTTDTGIRDAGGSFEPTGTDALYRFENGRPVAVARGEVLGRPNGVAVDRQGPVLVTFGTGKVYRVAADGSLTELERAAAGQLDSVLILEDGSLVLSSWETRSVYRFWPAGELEGQVRRLGEQIESPADIAYDAERRRVLVPSLNGNRLESRPVDP